MNEETYLVIRGLASDQPIHDAVSYFDELWTQRSLPVKEYLLQHPQYEMKTRVHEFSTIEQIDVLKTVKVVAQRNTSFTLRV
jgi:hypothetical protein